MNQETEHFGHEGNWNGGNGAKAGSTKSGKDTVTVKQETNQKLLTNSQYIKKYISKRMKWALKWRRPTTHL